MYGGIERKWMSGGLMVVVFLLFVSVSLARSEILFNNLNQAGLGQGTISSTYYKAQKFTTNNVGFSLESVTVRLRANTPGNLFISIYDSVGDLPNNAVGALNVPTVGPAYANYKVTPQAAIDLNSNETYWVVVGVTSGAGDYDWNYTASNTGTGYGFSSRWAYTINAGTTWVGDDTEPFIMEVLAIPDQPIPTLNEWGIIFLALLFAGSFYLMHRRRSREGC